MIAKISTGKKLSCMADKNIQGFSLGQKFLSYPCYLTRQSRDGCILVVIEFEHMVIKRRF